LIEITSVIKRHLSFRNSTRISYRISMHNLFESDLTLFGA
jgi:hypothetical protein